MYLWPTVAETADCWEDRATATVDVGWFWCLPPILPVARQHWQSQYILRCRSGFLCTHLFHHGFSYSWFQHNGCLFLHWSCIYYLLKTTLVTAIYLSCFFPLPMWSVPTGTEIALWNTIIFWNKQLFLSQQWNSQLFGICNEKQNSYLHNGSLYFNKWI